MELYQILIIVQNVGQIIFKMVKNVLFVVIVKTINVYKMIMATLFVANVYHNILLMNLAYVNSVLKIVLNALVQKQLIVLNVYQDILIIWIYVQHVQLICKDKQRVLYAQILIIVKHVKMVSLIIMENVILVKQDVDNVIILVILVCHVKMDIIFKMEVVFYFKQIV